MDVHVRGMRYHLDDRGAGHPLALLHGFTGRAASWSEHLGPLARHFRVLAIDQLGHGDTSIPADPARYRIDEGAADLIAVLQHAGALPAALLGYSMGGRLALYAALTYPNAFSALILESASPGLRGEAAQHERLLKDAALASGILEHGVRAFVDEWEQLSLFSTQRSMPAERRAMQRAIRLANDPLGLANSLRGMSTGAQPSLWERLPELTIPVLLITGSEDARFNTIADEMMTLFPNAQRVIVPGASHTIHVEQPDRYDEIVTGFLLQLAAT
ncbi:MAG: 2-succinyl-6-hydroxy-2,4-cyclohexadiene-1-carboxylate synthase [Anaerolineae bacterium]|nr:2-succinyl-6-hydroxy-2,4-cyclohexadiene-1-carboxylate synthase [Anaerolineae bacterium]